jgi:hypothetical protein
VVKDTLKENPYAKVPPGPPYYIRAQDPAPGATRVCLGRTKGTNAVALMPCDDPRVMRFSTKLEALEWLCAYYLEKCTIGKSPLALVVDSLNDH